MTFASVALDIPVDSPFDYEIGNAGVVVGSLVVVPFGRRRMVGIVVGLAQHSSVPRAKLRRIERILPAQPLPADSLALARFCAEYYRCPLGQVLAIALPTRLRRPGFGERTRVWEYVLKPGCAAQVAAHLPSRAQRLRRLLEALSRHEGVDSVQARLIYPRAAAVLREWTELGWVEKRAAPDRRGDTAPSKSHAVSPAHAPVLTGEQREALARISEHLDKYAAWLLQGVTGSGKTEVYLALIERVAAGGGQAMLLVPEINLTPQLEARLQARLPHLGLVSLHSGLAEGERLTRWERARRGEASIVLGTRLALFTPLPRLALVIVDEEQDTSFKQQEGLRYNARDMAVYLASSRGVPVVLGSATPSLETYVNALSGRFGHLRLTSRPLAAAPTVKLVDVRGKKLEHGLSEPLLAAITERLLRREQSLVFINRRGFAPTLLCHACGWTAECTRCAAKLTLHSRSAKLACHYCGREEPIRRACPSCGNQDLRGLGQGTQRVEEALAERFPRARILRVDSDSTRRRGTFAAMRESIHAEEVDILVGTQMLAKGHDFPKLTLVGVVGADHALFSSDFRAVERMFQQLMQVAGRAGRSDVPGDVFVQTEFPQHPLYLSLERQDFDTFAAFLLEDRRRADFPPYVYQAVLRAEAHRESDIWEFLHHAARQGAPISDEIALYDPVPASIPRIAGRFRGQLLVQAQSRPAMRRFLALWHPLIADEKATRVRWVLDVDPMDL